VELYAQKSKPVLNYEQMELNAGFWMWSLLLDRTCCAVSTNTWSYSSDWRFGTERWKAGMELQPRTTPVLAREQFWAYKKAPWCSIPNRRYPGCGVITSCQRAGGGRELLPEVYGNEKKRQDNPHSDNGVRFTLREE
jgi:hypothetical protein